MAAPMNIRIRLKFEDDILPNSWILVQPEKHKTIQQLSKDIKKRFGLSVAGSLWLKRCLLPADESVLVLREDDAVDVRFNEQFVHMHMKKKRKHEEQCPTNPDDPVESPPKKRAKKKKNRHKSSEEEVVDNVNVVEEQQTPVSECPLETSIQDTQTCSNMNALDPKRKRIRKHKRKRKTDSSTSCNNQSNSGINDQSGRQSSTSSYVGREVQPNETFYGLLPDKLEPPKHYRHGYRNKQMYKAQPNIHTTFDSADSDIEEGSMAQYNFLSRPKPTVIEGDNYSENVTNDVADPTTATLPTDFNNSNNESIHEPQCDIEQNVTQNDTELSVNGTGESSVLTDIDYSHSARNSFYQQPSSSIITSPRSGPEASPMLLDRRTLPNGVSVFSRRKSPRHQMVKELSKEDQLNTVASNVSTIFVNPPSAEFKVPASPVQKLFISSPSVSPSRKSESVTQPVVNPVVNGHTSPLSTTSQYRKDYSTMPVLKGLPEIGQHIAYKVLEISASCTPEMSDFKLAEVVHVDDGQMIQLRNILQAKKGPNKFHVELEDEEGTLTNTAQPEVMVTLHASSMLDARVVK